MKRKIIYLLLAVLLVASLAATASAAGSASLSASSTWLYRGSEVTVVAKLSGFDVCSAGSVTVSYDSGLELKDIKSRISGLNVNAQIENDRAIFYAMPSVDINGEVLAFTFKVKSDAAFQKNTVTVNFDVNGEKPSASVTLTVACNHKYTDWTDYSASSHFRKCTICGASETAEHAYDNACDTACNVCGREREITHQFSQEWMGDETGHYHTCTVCGEKDEVLPHTPGEEAGEYTDQVCTDCNMVLASALGHTHRYDDHYSYSMNGHWQLCTGCQEPTEAVSHEFDGDCDESCDTCGYTRTVTHQPGSWEHSDDNHWRNCTNCGEKLEKDGHTWDAGYVKAQATTETTGLTVYRCTVCMAEREEILAKLAPVNPVGGDNWWIWLAVGFAGGVVLTGSICILVITVKVKKKSKGRFAG